MSSVRSRGLALAAVVSAVVAFGIVLNRHEPIGHWLFLRYARAALSAGVFSAACLISGHAVLVRVLRRTLPLEEHVALAFALGVLAFYLTSFVFGTVGLYGPVFFVLGPCVLVALGARDFLRTLARFRRHAARVDFRIVLDPLRTLALVFGILGVAYLWFTILSPSNASYDARWYHLSIAEHYVSSGKIGRFGEGWVFGAFPQLASLLYAWAFSAPGVLFDRVETAAHLELAIFLMTLVGVNALVRRALGRRVPLAWVSLFLFPGIFCYDSGLVLGADHVAAVFAAPVALLSFRYFESPGRGVALLLGAVLGGALATKYSAAILVPLPVLVVVLRAVADARTLRGTRIVAPALTMVAALAAVTAPHWLKNWLFYGDPLFPLLHRLLPSAPWPVAAEAPYDTWFHPHRPPFALESVLDMARTLVTFSFVPHDFGVYHRDVPVFGSLFTLTTPLLFFVGRRRRLYFLFAGAYLGIAAWFWIHQFDRYLQVLVPWMASGTVVLLIRLFRRGGLLRVALAALVALQVVWCASVPFIPSHRGAPAGIIQTVSELLGRGFRGEWKEPPVAYLEQEAIARALPRGAKVLVHEERVRLGLSAPTVIDFPGEQGAFYFGEPGARTPGEVWRLLRAHSITHVLLSHDLDHGFDTVAGGLVFFDFAVHHTELVGRFGIFELRKLGEAPPSDKPPGEVLYATCEAVPQHPPRPPAWDPNWAPSRLFEPIFAPGLYPLGELARAPGDRRPISAPIPLASEAEALARARFLVLDARCHAALHEEATRSFEALATRGASTLYVRR